MVQYVCVSHTYLAMLFTLLASGTVGWLVGLSVVGGGTL